MRKARLRQMNLPNLMILARSRPSGTKRQKKFIKVQPIDLPLNVFLRLKKQNFLKLSGTVSFIMNSYLE